MLALPGKGFFIMTIQEAYTEERQRLELNRSLDWSTHNIEYKIAGEILKPMTLQVWFDLMVVKSPVVTGDDLSIESIIDYIWRNSIKNTSNKFLKEMRLYRLQSRVMKALKKDDTTNQLVKVLLEHIKSSFEEMPDPTDQAQGSKDYRMNAITGESSMLDELASRYGISPIKVLDFPLRQVFALQKASRLATIPEYKLLEPHTLRAIKSEYLNQIQNNGAE